VSLKLAAKLKVMTRPHSHVALHKQAIGWEVPEKRSLWTTLAKSVVFFMVFQYGLTNILTTNFISSIHYDLNLYINKKLCFLMSKLCYH